MKCVVITPVGPGHEKMAQECRRSVAAAIAHGRGIFSEIDHRLVDDTRGELGRSAARNGAVIEAAAAGVDWIFFLDADDLMVLEAFMVAAEALLENDAVWGAICEQLPDGQPRLREHQDVPLTDVMQLMRMNPFHSLQMGHFVKAGVAARFPFDPSLNAGEDFDYYLKVWLRQRCCKLPAPLFVNRRGFHSHGPKSATGQEWIRNVVQVMTRFVAENRSELVGAFSPRRYSGASGLFAQGGAFVEQRTPEGVAAFDRWDEVRHDFE